MKMTVPSLIWLISARRYGANVVDCGRKFTCMRGLVTNLGKADGLPPADWLAVTEKVDAGSTYPAVMITEGQSTVGR